ncbi:unnamed protein product [Notodromas monacha]|uniref:Ubiquitin carboxyl-terminal hydrolase MINDY n=1 Tax=Notodromas monacha TaxID=399045 RepID=A0A7R9GBW3_9CRUS|nr:unnamed protein product [Notodromas monacha]CAG0916953.1 unnamed protein product [Notodromas monacha]
MAILGYESLASTLEELQTLLWGPVIKQEIWERWSQGFSFSENEGTALLQKEGGPCAVIAPVQAFLLKNYLEDGVSCIENLRGVGEEGRKTMFLNSLSEIIHQASNGSEAATLVVQNTADVLEKDNGEAPPPIEMSAVDPRSPEVFLKNSTYIALQGSHEIHEALLRHFDVFCCNLGVLRFLYSVLLTKGLSNIKQEMEDPSEGLIDGIYGHGSQSLINLFLTGKAVNNVWDNTRDVGGLSLRGIPAQNKVGFLTTLEHHRYCEVGSYLKNPLYPVWLLGSETHLTVLFSFDSGLTAAESPREIAHRIFKSFDPEGNGFISCEKLQDIMVALNLVSEPEYVNIMRQKLDEEGLGIILRSKFMEEFYPQSRRESKTNSFSLFHYNGLERSCQDSKVVFQEGQAEVVDGEIQMMHDQTPILLCVQTKWPSIDVNWKSGRAPSLN